LRDYVEQHARKRVKLWRKQLRFLGLAYPPDGRGPSTLVPGGLAERWAGRPVRDLEVGDIRTAINEAQVSGVPGLARRATGATDPMARVLGSYLNAALGWMYRTQRIDARLSVAGLLPKAGKARERTLNDDEIVRFWNACQTLGAPLTQMLRLLLLTGVRRSELAGMRRSSELSTDGTEWVIPSSRTKNKREHKVPLVPLTRRILASVPVIEGPADFVFTFDGKRAVANWSTIKDRLDAAMALPPSALPWVIHDLRRSFVTRLADLGVRPDVIELTVNHVSGMRSGVAGIYNRSPLLPERRDALETWARHVEDLVAGRSNVVALRK
jgi:integrase